MQVIRVETHVACNGGQRWHIDAAHVTEGHVGPTNKVGEADLQVHGVGSKRQLARNILQVVDIDRAEIWVVVDVKNFNCLELNTIGCVELGVRDENVSCLLNTLGEAETLQRRQANPVDLIDRCQRVKIQVGQNGHVLHIPGTADRVELIGCEGRKLGGVVDFQITSKLLDAIECNGTTGLVRNGNSSGEFRAALQGIGIGLGVDG